LKRRNNKNERDYVIRQRQEIYDEICRVLTLYEECDDDMDDVLYEMLSKVQHNWEDIITVQID
jgi:hypothetical protein